MKANELMIGDWVYCSQEGCEGHQIDLIDDGNNVVGLDGELLLIEDIKPIPLTDEILEHNGFRITSEHADYYFEENGEKMDFCMRRMYDQNDMKKQCGWGHMSYNILILIDYVHQLQHALRLCGIEKEIII